MNRSSAQLAKAVCMLLGITVGMMPSLKAGLGGPVMGLSGFSFVGQERPANSYRTDLWKMEFQKPDEDKEESSTDEDADGPTAGIRRASEEGSKEWGEIPGDVYLSDVSQETPFAEWQVDKSASGKFQHFSTGPTAWVMSHVRAKGAGFHTEIPKANGPSMLTLLVAIIACMVMIGALFAER